MADHSSEHTTSPPIKAESTRELVWILLLVVVISITTSVIGPILYMRIVHQTPPIKLGIVDIQRLTRTLTAGQPNGTASLTRFDEAARSLVDTEPGLILLVKEAVVGPNHPDDYTDALISLLQSPPPPDRPRN